MRTRTSTQARSHAQKFFVKLERKSTTLEDFLESIDFNNLKNIASELLEFEDEEEDLEKISVGQKRLSSSSFGNSSLSDRNSKSLKYSKTGRHL